MLCGCAAESSPFHKSRLEVQVEMVRNMFPLGPCCHCWAKGRCLSQKSAWDIPCPCPMLQNPLQSHKSCPPALLLEGARRGRQAMVLSPLWHCDTLLLTSTPRWTSPMWPQPPCPGTPQEIHSASHKKKMFLHLASPYGATIKGDEGFITAVAEWQLSEY